MTETVDALLEERIEGEIQAVSWYKSRGAARYAFVAALDEDQGTATLSTVLLDVEDETLRVLGDNSMWLPAEPGILDVAVRSLARTTTAVNDGIAEDDGPMRESLLEFDADAIGSWDVDDDYDPSDADDWKAREGADEMDVVHERFAESPVETAERMIMLEWGEKRPWDGSLSREMHHPDDIAGNYGVEVDKDDDLIIVDVDDLEGAEDALDALPETLASHSPHGGVHRFYHVPGWLEAFRERFDVLNPHPPWGDLRASDGYVVGPGSTLEQCKYGCTHAECDAKVCGHGCCTEDDPGEYLLDDAPIATVDADEMAELLAAARGGETA